MGRDKALANPLKEEMGVLPLIVGDYECTCCIATSSATSRPSSPAIQATLSSAVHLWSLVRWFQQTGVRPERPIYASVVPIKNPKGQDIQIPRAWTTLAD